MRRLGSSLTCLVLLSVALPAAAAGAVSRPVVRSVAAVPRAATPGESFTAKVTVGAKARRASRRRRARVVLSRDRRADARDARVATVVVPALKRGRRKVLSVRVDLSPSLPAGSYRLIACIRARCRKSSPFVVGRIATGAGPGPVAGVPGAVASAQPAPTAAPGATGATADPGSSPNPDPTPEPGLDPAAAPPAGNPLDVTPVLDTARATSRVITAADGGQITATAADGARFTLAVPPDGVLDDTKITLTPLDDLRGRPFAAPATAVDLQPHGLTLPGGATLTITPATPIPVAQQFVFAARQGGKDFHAYAPTSATDVITLPLQHFSDYGVAGATTEELVAASARTPADADAQIEKLAGELLQDQRRSGKAFDSSSLLQPMRDRYANVVLPRLEAASHDDTLAVLAVTGYLSWQRTTQLLGLGDDVADLVTEGHAHVRNVIEFAYDVAYERCKAKQTAYVPVLMILVRTAAMAGVEDIGADVMDRLVRCARYEMDYDVRVKQDTVDLRSGGSRHPETHWDITVEAHDIPLVLELTQKGPGDFLGERPPVVTNFTYSDNIHGCAWTASRAEILEPVRMEASIGLQSRLETQADGRTRYVLIPPRPAARVFPGKLKMWLKNCTGDEFTYTGNEYESIFFSVWEREKLAERPGYFRFSAFFLESPPLLGLFLDERNTHREFDQFVTDRFSRLRMEIEHQPQQ